MLSNAPSLISQKTSIGLGDFHIAHWYLKNLKGKSSEPISCIYYLLQFGKDKGKNVLALLNFGSKINTMTSVYVAYLYLKVEKTNIAAQIIVVFLVKAHGMVIAAF